MADSESKSATPHLFCYQVEGNVSVVFFAEHTLRKIEANLIYLMAFFILACSKEILTCVDNEKKKKKNPLKLDW